LARRIPESRFDELVRGATEVFIARGYRQTQMSDIAEAVGVAKGTLYGYVESKDALLMLCLRFADDEGPIGVPEGLPLVAPTPGSIRRAVQERLASEVSWKSLETALELDRSPDIQAELARVIGEFFDVMTANRHRIKMLDRCMDHPELGHLWQTVGREQSRLALAHYLTARVEAGQIRELPDVRLATRFVIETCATWAVHIHWDRAPESYDPAEARANAIDFLVRGLVPGLVRGPVS
jgi:AcrR family transcriptional regulator